MSDSDESTKNPMLDKFYRIPIRLSESDLEISDTESVISKSVKTGRCIRYCLFNLQNHRT